MADLNVGGPSQSINDPLPELCLCNVPHPCPQHGAWARPTDEQLVLIPAPRR